MPKLILKGESSLQAEPSMLLAIPKLEPGYIEFDDRIISTNIVTQYQEEGTPLPPGWRQSLDSYDFHRFEFKALVKSPYRARGVKAFRIDARVITDKDADGDKGVLVEDHGPKTEWKEASSPQSEIALDFGWIGEGLKLLRLPVGSPVSGKIIYKWNPKVAAVLAGAAGSGLWWTLNAVEGQYLDGEHWFIVVIRRRRDVQNMWLEIKPGSKDRDQGTWALVDIPFYRPDPQARYPGEDVVYIDEGARIPIEFKPSRVPA